MLIPITKVDEARRLVVGRAAQEVADRSGEIMDYASAKPAFKAWSDEAFAASGGKSYGNIRAMHGNIAAGKLESIGFDDASKSIDITAHIIDDNEWAKVMAGVYTGFSMGGQYAKRWKDGDLTRYTPVVAEISIVDRPCVPTAQFADILKSDGSVGRIFLKGTTMDQSDMIALLGKADAAQLAAVKALLLGKAGKEISAKNADHLAAIQTAASDITDRCAQMLGHDDEDHPETEKADGGKSLVKMQAELAKVSAERDALKAKWDAAPQDPKGVTRIVAKSDDAQSGNDSKIDALEKSLAKMTPEQQAQAVLKFTMTHGGKPLRI